MIRTALCGVLQVCAAGLAVMPASAAVGTTGGQLLEVSPSARAEGMGGAFTAVADNSNSVFYNPAGLGNVDSVEIPLSNSLLYDGVRFQHAGLAYNLHDIRSDNLDDPGTLAVTFSNFDTGGIPGRNAAGVPTGSFSVRSDLIAVSYGKHLINNDASGRLLAGVSAKFLDEKIAGNSASTSAFDAGLLWTDPADCWSLGASILNMGSKVKYVYESDKLPQSLRAGAAVRAGGILAALDIVKPDDGDISVNVGGETMVGDALAVRLGYDSREDDATGLRAGIGVVLKAVDVFFVYANEIDFDYAYIPSENLGNLHKFSMILKLGVGSGTEAQ